MKEKLEDMLLLLSPLEMKKCIQKNLLSKGYQKVLVSVKKVYKAWWEPKTMEELGRE